MRRTDLPRGIRLRAQPAVRTGQIFKPEKPWEQSDAGFSVSTVIQDGTTYKAWGGNFYFESTDGMNWRRPDLGLVERDGSRKNNLLENGVGTVFKDPAGPESERYKWVNDGDITKEQLEVFKTKRPDAWDQRAFREDVGRVFGVFGGVSSDGLRWTRLEDPLVVEHSDTQNTAYFDERLRKYVIYTRNYMIGPRSENAGELGFRSWWDAGRRSIGRTESDNFREFPLSEVIMEPSSDMAPHDLLYTNCKTTIPGAPDQHLMFPAIWHAAADDTTSIALASSHDGKLWSFVPGGPVLETAPFGEWDGGCVFSHPNLIELPNGDWALPYTGFIYPHKYPRGKWKLATGYALWPKGRLVALEAPEYGEFATVAIVPPGRKLRVNALTMRGGSVLVEVCGLDRNLLDGRSFADAKPIVGDQQAAPAVWKGQDDLGHKDGTAIVLRFRLDRAKLFGLEFA